MTLNTVPRQNFAGSSHAQVAKFRSFPSTWHGRMCPGPDNGNRKEAIVIIELEPNATVSDDQLSKAEAAVSAMLRRKGAFSRKEVCGFLARETAKLTGYEEVMCCELARGGQDQLHVIEDFMSKEKPKLKSGNAEPQTKTEHLAVADVLDCTPDGYDCFYPNLIVDVREESADLVPAVNAHIKSALDLRPLVFRSPSSRQKRYLEKNGMRGVYMVPLFTSDAKLWGILLAISYSSKYLTPAERAAILHLVDSTALMLAAAIEAERRNAERLKEIALASLRESVLCADDMEESILYGKPNGQDFLPCSGMSVVTPLGIRSCGNSPSHIDVAVVAEWVRTKCKTKIWTSQNISEILAEGRAAFAASFAPNAGYGAGNDATKPPGSNNSRTSKLEVSVRNRGNSTGGTGANTRLHTRPSSAAINFLPNPHDPPPTIIPTAPPGAVFPAITLNPPSAATSYAAPRRSSPNTSVRGPASGATTPMVGSNGPQAAVDKRASVAVNGTAPTGHAAGKGIPAAIATPNPMMMMPIVTPASAGSMVSDPSAFSRWNPGGALAVCLGSAFSQGMLLWWREAVENDKADEPESVCAPWEVSHTQSAVALGGVVTEVGYVRTVEEIVLGLGGLGTRPTIGAWQLCSTSEEAAESIPFPLAVIGPDGCVQMCNTPAATLLKRKKDAMVGIRFVEEIVGEEDRPRLSDALIHASDSSHAQHFIFRPNPAVGPGHSPATSRFASSMTCFLVAISEPDGAVTKVLAVFQETPEGPHKSAGRQHLTATESATDLTMNASLQDLHRSSRGDRPDSVLASIARPNSSPPQSILRATMSPSPPPFSTPTPGNFSSASGNYGSSMKPPAPGASPSRSKSLPVLKSPPLSTPFSDTRAPSTSWLYANKQELPMCAEDAVMHQLRFSGEVKASHRLNPLFSALSAAHTNPHPHPTSPHLQNGHTSGSTSARSNRSDKDKGSRGRPDNSQDASFELCSLMKLAVLACSNLAAVKGIELKLGISKHSRPVLHGDRLTLRGFLVRLIFRTVQTLEGGRVMLTVGAHRRRRNAFTIELHVITLAGVERPQVPILAGLFQDFMDTLTIMYVQ